MPVPVGPLVAIQFTFAMVALSLVAKWYVLPALQPLPLRSALPPLMLPHLLRPVSLWLLAPGAMVKPTIPEGFAMGTAYGDIVAASLALVALLLVRYEARGAVAVAWLFNGVGFLDAFRNVLVGVKTDAPAHMDAMGFVPAYAVPLVFVTHALIFKLLIEHRRRTRAAG